MAFQGLLGDVGQQILMFDVDGGQRGHQIVQPVQRVDTPCQQDTCPQQAVAPEGNALLGHLQGQDDDGKGQPLALYPQLAQQVAEAQHHKQ